MWSKRAFPRLVARRQTGEAQAFRAADRPHIHGRSFGLAARAVNRASSQLRWTVPQRGWGLGRDFDSDRPRARRPTSFLWPAHQGRPHACGWPLAAVMLKPCSAPVGSADRLSTEPGRPGILERFVFLGLLLRYFIERQHRQSEAVLLGQALFAQAAPSPPSISSKPPALFGIGPIGHRPLGKTGST